MRELALAGLIALGFGLGAFTMTGELGVFGAVNLAGGGLALLVAGAASARRFSFAGGPQSRRVVAIGLLRVVVALALAVGLERAAAWAGIRMDWTLEQRFELSPAQLGLLTSTYFLTFAAFQLPLGLLLDRFGPRRTDAALLLVAAGGAFLFAAAGDASALALGRALIGLGVSGCLMSGIKANVLWFPPQRLPAMNGWMFFAGRSHCGPTHADLSLTRPSDEKADRDRHFVALEQAKERGKLRGLLQATRCLADLGRCPDERGKRHVRIVQ